MLAALALAANVIVAPGNTLSGIASHHGITWEQLWYANRSKIANPNLIYPGQDLAIPGPHSPSAWLTAASGDGDHDADDGTVAVAAHRASSPTAMPVYHPVVDPGGTFHGTTSMQQCIISRESGGQAQIWNASGHYGLYQFSYSTWVGHGGSPSLFGHASAAYQTQVFWATVAADGYSDWAPYDGC